MEGDLIILEEVLQRVERSFSDALRSQLKIVESLLPAIKGKTDIVYPICLQIWRNLSNIAPLWMTWTSEVRELAMMLDIMAIIRVTYKALQFNLSLSGLSNCIRVLWYGSRKSLGTSDDVSPSPPLGVAKHQADTGDSPPQSPSTEPFTREATKTSYDELYNALYLNVRVDEKDLNIPDDLMVLVGGKSVPPTAEGESGPSKDSGVVQPPEDTETNERPIESEDSSCDEYVKLERQRKFKQSKTTKRGKPGAQQHCENEDTLVNDEKDLNIPNNLKVVEGDKSVLQTAEGESGPSKDSGVVQAPEDTETNERPIESEDSSCDEYVKLERQRKCKQSKQHCENEGTLVNDEKDLNIPNNLKVVEGDKSALLTAEGESGPPKDSGVVQPPEDTETNEQPSESEDSSCDEYVEVERQRKFKQSKTTKNALVKEQHSLAKSLVLREYRVLYILNFEVPLLKELPQTESQRKLPDGASLLASLLAGRRL